MREVSRRAEALSLPALAAQATRAADHDQNLWAMRDRRRYVNEGHYGPDAFDMDNRVDHCVVGLHSYLDSQTRMYRDMPQGQAATALLTRLFPKGPGAIIRLPYAQQHTAVHGLLLAADDPALADDIAQLTEFPGMLERLRTVNEEYAAVLNAYNHVPQPDVVREAQARGQDLMAEVIVLILAHGIDGSPESIAARDHLLEPVQRQNQAIRQSRRRRRPAQDVDPDTGAELPNGDGDGDDDAGLPVDGQPNGGLPGDNGASTDDGAGAGDDSQAPLPDSDGGDDIPATL